MSSRFFCFHQFEFQHSGTRQSGVIGSARTTEEWCAGRLLRRGFDTALDFTGLSARNARKEGAQMNARLSTFEFPQSPATGPVQKIASGLSGEPVPRAIRSGAAVNRNS